ncbi:hypothetical protein NW765_016144 [Fusarium oxysporum]|nr:hypothetical protein NW765_016144 [Fusarium oxysporum]KAJ4280889.1 hypothetical protein NW764_005233 [Fusarium oxysporum]
MNLRCLMRKVQIELNRFASHLPFPIRFFNTTSRTLVLHIGSVFFDFFFILLFYLQPINIYSQINNIIPPVSNSIPDTLCHSSTFFCYGIGGRGPSCTRFCRAPIVSWTDQTDTPKPSSPPHNHPVTP